MIHFPSQIMLEISEAGSHTTLASCRLSLSRQYALGNCIRCSDNPFPMSFGSSKIFCQRVSRIMLHIIMLGAFCIQRQRCSALCIFHFISVLNEVDVQRFSATLQVFQTCYLLKCYVSAFKCVNIVDTISSLSCFTGSRLLVQHSAGLKVVQVCDCCSL